MKERKDGNTESVNIDQLEKSLKDVQPDQMKMGSLHTNPFGQSTTNS